MTGKELQKLKRQELLQLLLEQSKEVAQLQERHGEADQQARELELFSIGEQVTDWDFVAVFQKDYAVKGPLRYLMKLMGETVV